MRWFFNVCFLLLSVSSIAQTGVVTFKVDKPDVKISINPNDSTFWVERNNHLYISVEEGKSKIGHVRLSEGTIRKIGPNEYVASFDTVCETVLKVYEIQPNGKSKLAFSRPYKVIAKPLPVITVAGVKADSAVGIKRLLHLASLEADLANSSVRPAVMGFKLLVSIGGAQKTMSTVGNKLSLAMRNEIRRLAPGQMLEFRDIQVKMPDGDVKVIESVAVFLVETDEYNVGRSGILEGVGR